MIDIAHITYRPPFATGSFNRMIGEQIKKLSDFSHIVYSYWESPIPSHVKLDPRIILVNRRQCSSFQKLQLLLPGRWRSKYAHNIYSPEHLAFLWGIQRLLVEHQPRIIVTYDNWKLGPPIRKITNWPCRLILSQRGLTYMLPLKEAQKVYNLRVYDAVWVLSHASYEYDLKAYGEYHLPVAVLPNGIDTQRFYPVNTEQKVLLRRSLGLPADRLIVLLLSRQVPKKGAHLIVESWKRILEVYPDAYLWIVGGGDAEYLQYLHSLIQALGISDSVKLEGAIAPENTQHAYQASDLYVFPTLWPEGHALSVLEAMACGLPCVLSAHDSALSLYSSNDVIFVPRPNIQAAFVQPILQLLQNKELRTQYGTHARSTVVSQYSYDVAFQRYREFYVSQLDLLPQINRVSQ